MEPSGFMDEVRLDISPSLASKASKVDYDIYDMGEEDVHFTRNPQPGNPYGYSFLSVPSPHLTEAVLNHAHAPSVTAEQVKSSKLLNKIGSKLRRGSNYLAAPTLVGQYLLGITIRSWSEFLNTSRMLKAPSNTNQLTRRLLNNLSHFQGNYLCVSLILVIYCILTSPLLLLAIVAYVSALYFVTARIATGKQLNLLGYRPNLQQQYSFLTLISLPLLWVAGAPSAVFWVIGASFVVVGLHASMYNGERPIEGIANEQPVTGGFRSIQVPHYSNCPLPASNHRYVSLPIPSSRPPTSTSSAGAFSQWMSFGGNTSAGQQVANKATGRTSEPASCDKRLPSVTIISQDFAGLGRVYEV